VRFLLHGQLGDRVPEALAEHRQVAVRPAELSLPEQATPTQILHACRERQYELITTSRDFLDTVLPGSGRTAIFGRVLVFLQDKPEEHELAIHRLFERYKRLTPGRLYTVTGGRVKVRQLPSGPATPSRAGGAPGKQATAD
jgi:hypothetical protein